MTLQKLIINYADFNLWANQELVNWLSKKTNDQLHLEVPSSFSTILKTLNHMWAIEEYWYSVINGSAMQVQRYGIEHLDAEEVFQGLLDRSRLLSISVSKFSEAALTETIKVISPWFEANQPRYEYIQHIVNHGTYHRGQVVTIGRNAGITDAPMTDYNAFNIMKAYVNG